MPDNVGGLVGFLKDYGVWGVLTIIAFGSYYGIFVWRGQYDIIIALHVLMLTKMTEERDYWRDRCEKLQDQSWRAVELARSFTDKSSTGGP